MLAFPLDFAARQPATIHLLLSHHTGYYDKHGNEITQAAFYAIKAAMMVKQIGRDAAQRYAIRNGSSLRLFCLAQQLQAANKFDKAEPI